MNIVFPEIVPVSRWLRLPGGFAIAALLMALLTMGCGGGSDEQSGPWKDGETVRFAIGETRTLPGGNGTQLRLLAVTKDSRKGPLEETNLPGTVEMRFAMIAPETEPNEFQILLGPMQTEVAAASNSPRYRIQVVDVEPGKNLADTIPPERYRMIVRASLVSP